MARPIVFNGTMAGYIRPVGFLSVAETMEFWRLQHGCSGQKATLLPHRLAADPTRVELVEWIGCRTDNVVWLYRVAGGGHQVPSSPQCPRAGCAKRDGKTRISRRLMNFGNLPRALAGSTVGTSACTMTALGSYETSNAVAQSVRCRAGFRMPAPARTSVVAQSSRLPRSVRYSKNRALAIVTNSHWKR